MPNVIAKTVIPVGSKRRITLPDIVPFAVHDDILVERMDDGTVILSATTKQIKPKNEKVKIYGYIIGKRLNERAWILFVDQYGLPVARKSSSTLDLAKSDILRPDVSTCEKFDNKCGLNNWEKPKLIDSVNLFECPSNVVAKITATVDAYRKREWPPMSTGSCER